MYTDYVDGAIAGAHLSTWKTSRGSWCTLKSRDARSLWPWYWILDRLVTGSASFHVGAVYCFLVPVGCCAVWFMPAFSETRCLPSPGCCRASPDNVMWAVVALFLCFAHACVAFTCSTKRIFRNHSVDMGTEIMWVVILNFSGVLRSPELVDSSSSKLALTLRVGMPLVISKSQDKNQLFWPGDYVVHARHRYGSV